MDRMPPNIPDPPQYATEVSDRELLVKLLKKVDRLHQRIDYLKWNQKQYTTTLLRKIEQITTRLDTTTAQFLHFTSFPFEIRQYIWNLAIPRRLLALPRERRSYQDEYPLRPPAVAHVCREARKVAIHSGGMCFTHLYLPTPAWTWFSPSKDILLANAKSTIKGIDGAAEHVLVLADDLYGVLSYKDTAQPWPRVKRISVHFGNFERCDLGVWPLGREHSPEAISKLLGLDAVRLLELDDDVAVENTCRVLERAKEPSSELLLRDIRLGREIVHGRCEYKQLRSWRDELQRVLEGWLKAQFARSVLSINLEDLLLEDVEEIRGLINKAHPWVQRELSAMPEIRPVFAMIRTDEFPRLQVLMDD